MTNKLNDEFILDMGDIEDEELSPLLDNDSADSVEENQADENQAISEKSVDINEKENANEDKELSKDDLKWNRPILAHPSIDLKQRILNLAQKGDWEACETALNILEKETPQEDTKPMNNITDEVEMNKNDLRNELKILNLPRF